MPYEPTMILVAGATGYLGGTIARGLLEQGQRVRVLVRPGSDYASLLAAGAEVVYGDLKDADSLRAACAGASIVITTANSAQRGGADNAESVDLRGNRNFIDAARAEAVQHYIFISAYGADAAHPVPFLAAKGRTEEHLRGSALTYTILAPHVFMDVWIPLVVGSAIQENRPVLLLGPGERKHSFIALADVAGFAISATHNPAARNQKLALGGPEAIAWRDIVSICEQVLGRAIPIQTVRPSALPHLSELIVGLLSGIETTDVIISMGETARGFGVQQTSVRKFIERAFRER